MGPRFVDTLWLAIKYTAPVVTAFYGFYAIVTDFRVETNGKKILSRKAYWGMALLVVSTALGIGSDAHKDKEDRVQANIIISSLKSAAEMLQDTQRNEQELSENLKFSAEALSETKKKVDKTLNATATVLQETLKAADPIDHNWGVYTRIGVPLDQPPVQAYLRRVLPAGPRYFEFNAGEPGFPDKKIDGAGLANLASFTRVWVGFYNGREALPKLSISADCDTPAETAGRSKLEKKQVTYQEKTSFSEASFEISCMSDRVHESEEGASVLRSYREFPGLRVLVMVTIEAKKGNPGINFQMPQFSLITPTRRYLTMPALNATGCPGSTVYVGEVWAPRAFVLNRSYRKIFAFRWRPHPFSQIASADFEIFALRLIRIGIRKV